MQTFNSNFCCFVYWVGKNTSLGGQKSLFGGQLPTQLACYPRPCETCRKHLPTYFLPKSSTIQTFTRHLLRTVVQTDRNDSIIKRLLCRSSLHNCHAGRSPIHSRRGAHPVTSHSGHQKPAPMNRGAADSGLNAGRRGGPPSNSSPAVTNPLVGCHMHTAEARYRSGEPRQATAGDRVGSPQKR